MKYLHIDVTPQQVVRYWGKQKVNITEANAAQWLRKHATKITKWLQPVVDQELEDWILCDVFGLGLPEPHLNKVYKEIVCRALSDAEHAFAKRLGLELRSAAIKDLDDVAVAQYFQTSPDSNLTVLVDYEYEFAATHTPFRLLDPPKHSHYDVLVTRENGKFSAAVYERGDSALTGYRAFGDVTTKQPAQPSPVPAIRMTRQTALFIDDLKTHFSRVFGRKACPGDPVFFDHKNEGSQAASPSKLQALSKRAGVNPELMYAANKCGRIVTETTGYLLTDQQQRQWLAAIADYHRARVQVN